MKSEIQNGMDVVAMDMHRGVTCDDCCFTNDRKDCNAAPCASVTRSDSRNVYFVKLEKPIHTENWEDVAKQTQHDKNYYRGVLVQVGELLGIAAYTSDDGSIQDSVLCAKIPELVAKKVFDNTVLTTKVALLEFEIQQLGGD